MGKESQLEKLHDIPASMYSKIIWGVYKRYFSRHEVPKRIAHGKKEQFYISISSDIYTYITTAITLEDLVEDETLLSEIKSSKLADYTTLFNKGKKNPITMKAQILHKEFSDAEDSEYAIKLKTWREEKELCESRGDVFRRGEPQPKKIVYNKLVEESNLKHFLGSIKQVYQCVDSNIACGNTSRLQLEVLCLYGWDKTYDQLKESRDLLIQDDFIRFIPTRIKKDFADPILKVIDAFENANESSESPVLNKLKSSMFIEKTRYDIEHLAKGQIPLPAEIYLDTLLELMKVYHTGFGINIPIWEPNWESTKSEDILKENEARKNYIRIFLLEGDANRLNQLTDDEENMIRKQLKHEVTVFIVFKAAWNNLEKEALADLDFAILNIERQAVLMKTIFDGVSPPQGIFYTNPKTVREHYKRLSDQILTVQNCEYIFCPSLNQKTNKIILGEKLKAIHLTGLITELEKTIYHNSILN